MVTKLRALHFLVITGVGGLLEWAQNDPRVFHIRALSTFIWRSWPSRLGGRLANNPDLPSTGLLLVC